jgi:hypothetical protein
MKTTLKILFILFIIKGAVAQNNTYSNIEVKETFDDIFYLWNIDYVKNVERDKIDINPPNHVFLYASS